MQTKTGAGPWHRVLAAALTLAPVPAWAADPPQAVLPSGRVLAPVGDVATTPNFPTQVVASGDVLAVLDGGANKAQSLRLYAAGDLAPQGGIATLKTKEGRRAAPGATVAQGKPGAAEDEGDAGTIKGQSLFQGLAAGPDGTLYATGGDSDDLLALRRQGGTLRLVRRYALQWQPFPRSQYPYQYAGNWQQPRHFYPDSVVIGPRGRHAYVSGMLSNSVARIDLQSGATAYLHAGSYPYAVALADGARRLVVSDWGGNGVTVIDRAAWKVLGEVPTGPVLGPRSAGAGAHPTALAAQPGTPLVWVADANLDRIVAVDTRSLKAVRSIDDAPYPGAPPGSYPDALAVANGRLFVANAGNDDVAIYDLKTGRRIALVPTGWYPTSLAVQNDALDVVSAKGMGSGPNVHHQWVGDFMHGLLQRVDLRELPAHAAAWTRQALDHNGFGAAQRRVLAAANARATAWLHGHIRHVVFILRENKTFDEALGKYPGAGPWADPKLDLYGPRELPNLYTMAEHGALFVHFYADGEVTSQGHQWTTAGSDSDVVQRTWPLYYSDRGYIANSGWTQSLAPDARGARNPHAIYQNLSALGHWSNPWITYPARLFLFNDLLAHHVSFEDFGEFASRNRIGDISPALRQHLAVDYPAWDRLVLDTDRAAIAQEWLRAHPLPRVLYIWLPDDHTAGRAPCLPSPDSYVANNDLATAQVIHAVSRLPQWKHTLVLLTEDDAQSGADHIDAHRTFAVAAGPWVKPGMLVTQHLSQVDLLRTIEAVAGIAPMSQWDANAHVLDGIWRAHPDAAQTQVLPMEFALQRNPGTCPADSPFAAMPVAQVPGDMRLAAQSPEAARRYTPTELLKISGPEQMRQVWLATKGPQAYAAMLAHVQALAARQHRPVSSLVAGKDADD
ncbi:bifunctional YncE family protein/alkaline phosphatase family protein [Thiomonas sp.]|uniref:bifunctional YncE family protein/alkaline phosphatase family protein n=1 Tax=Thiomonas sp. TaxID=2047785 RepID=UPI00258795DB|nr:bifunctional YncE family protein/alkaline phosphatase family protein [Thiomonas sp.]